jgi:UDP-N-acetylmuramoyl-L-alanyl-D-glutamate--2,6-diaminopimelate ligase
MALQLLPGVTAAASWLAARTRGTLTSDSRTVRDGDAFIAWPGAAHDARRFVRDALAAGAAAALVEAEGAEAFDLDDGRIAAMHGLKAATGEIAHLFFGRPSDRLAVVATTGTNGKTSTACWTAQALSTLGRRCGVIGTLGIGEPGALVPSGLTTPDPVTLQAALRRFADEGLLACAIEASSIGLAERRLDGTRIEVALFTNFTQDHLDYHGSMAAYWACKRMLFAWPGLRAAVINIDDDTGAALADALRDERLDFWTVALGRPARLRGEALRHTGDGITFDVIEGAQAVVVHTRLLGQFNASNVLVVIGALRALGVRLVDAAGAVASLTPVPGRLQRVDDAGSPLVIVDYAHTPDALDQVLQALQPLVRSRGGRLWCVFGCGGDRDPGKRPLMGAIAARAADHVVITSDNPRSEAPATILAQILAGARLRDDVDVIEDRAQAIAHAVTHAGVHDAVLIAGKGHEDYQDIGGVRRPFSDTAVAREYLRRRQEQPA